MSRTRAAEPPPSPRPDGSRGSQGKGRLKLLDLALLLVAGQLQLRLLVTSTLEPARKAASLLLDGPVGEQGCLKSGLLLSVTFEQLLVLGETSIGNLLDEALQVLDSATFITLLSISLSPRRRIPSTSIIGRAPRLELLDLLLELRTLGLESGRPS